MTDVIWGRIVIVGSFGTEIGAWEIDGRTAPDLSVVEALAHWQLFLRRQGATLHLRDVSPALMALLDLTGLLDVMGLVDATGSGREMRREPEAPEERFGAEEEMQSQDPRA